MQITNLLAMGVATFAYIFPALAALLARYQYSYGGCGKKLWEWFTAETQCPKGGLGSLCGGVMSPKGRLAGARTPSICHSHNFCRDLRIDDCDCWTNYDSRRRMLNGEIDNRRYHSM